MRTALNRGIAAAALAAAAATLSVTAAGTATAATPTAAKASSHHSATTSRSTRVHPDTCADNYYVTASALRIHTGPGTGYTAFGQLYRDDTVVALRSSGNWAYVEVTYSNSLSYGTRGWVSWSYLAYTPCSTLD